MMIEVGRREWWTGGQEKKQKEIPGPGFEPATSAQPCFPGTDARMVAPIQDLCPLLRSRRESGVLTTRPTRAVTNVSSQSVNIATLAIVTCL
jgi:hypothetical protein